MSERRTVFITGASRGIGHATANYFVQHGWRVVTCSRDEVPPNCPRDERHAHITLDLNDTEPAGRGHHAPAQHSRGPGAARAGQQCRLLAQGRGRQTAGLPRRRPRRLATDLRDQLLRPRLLQPRLAPLLAETQGSIVNITSIAGHRVHPFAGSAYSTSKAALTALTRELAADLAHLGIRANAVCPGEINTAILSPGTEALVERIPMRRLGSPEEVAAAIYYLCSPEASYITGAEIPVNGGQDVH